MAVGPDRCRVGEELAACVELLLGELDGDTEQTVEVVLRLGEALSRQEVTNQLTWVQRRVSWRRRMASMRLRTVCWSSGSSCPIASR
ncbi:MAG: hypothetical protein KDB26_08935 [Microthrixaceae bacterium]|nr:hypothetical protein [Microthrixaceae bacterium]